MAGRQIDDIWIHVARLSQSIETADRTVEQIYQSIALIARIPKIGRLRSVKLVNGFRTFPVGDFVIVYKASKGVRVTGVYHQRRQIFADTRS